MAIEPQEPRGVKRPLDPEHDDPQPAPPDASASDSDSDIGPALPSSTTQAPKKKKRRTLPHEPAYLAALPTVLQYSKSLMHREQLSFCTFTPGTDFLITASADGCVKFWKLVAGGVEFVKEFVAHEQGEGEGEGEGGAIRGVSVSVDGRSYATLGRDGTVKVFDVLTFDLLAVLEVGAQAKVVCFVHGFGAAEPLLAVGVGEDCGVAIYDGSGERKEPVHVVRGLHRKAVHLLAYNPAFDCVVSADEGGTVEYWRPSGLYEKPEGVFGMKSTTSLFEFKKAKSVPTSITISPTGRQFATFSFPDRKVRVFDFASGKLYRTYDESLATITEMQQAGTLSTPPLDA
ncbi:Peptidyl-prolyl cis-trans isomerase cyp15, partial [Teratosphaeriaceae sp. CCFEE 6253]